jgi:hypothetical protein
MLESGGAFHLVYDRIKRAVRVLRGAEIAQPRVRFGGEVFQQRGRQPRLADARFTGEQHDLPFVRLCPRPAPKQQFEFFFPPNEGGQTARVQRLEAALHGSRPQRRKDPHPPRDALEIYRPEVVKLEQIAEQLSRTLGDDDHVRLGDALQACRKVGGLADDAALLRLPGPDEIADHDQAGCNSDAHPEQFFAAQLAHRFGERQPGPDSPLGIVLVRLWIAEIHQHPVAHVLGDETVEPGDRLGDALVIGADYGTQIFGIELCRERRRADEVGEHDGELATLRIVPWLLFGRAGGLRHDGSGAENLDDRCQHFSPMSEQDADFLKVLIR